MSPLSSVDIVVPIYNEEATVPELLERLRRSCPGARLIFVDNASTDQTAERLAAEPDVVLVRHARNLGYGRSLVDGIRAGDREKVVMIDADLEYLPEDIPAIARALESEPAVYGSRFLGPDAGSMSRTRRFGNRVATSFFNLLFGQRLTDIYTGVRGFRREWLECDRYHRDGFDFIVELTATTASHGVRIAEVPAGYRPRTTGASQMKHVREFVKFVHRALVHRLAR